MIRFANKPFDEVDFKWPIYSILESSDSRIPEIPDLSGEKTFLNELTCAPCGEGYLDFLDVA